MGRWHNYGGHEGLRARKARYTFRWQLLDYIASCKRGAYSHDIFDGRYEVSETYLTDALEWLEQVGYITASLCGWVYGDSYTMYKAIATREDM